MQNEPRENHGSTENHIHNNHNDDHGAPTTLDAEPPKSAEAPTHNGYSERRDVEDYDTDHVHSGPPSKKRKLADSATRPSSTPRHISPPWKNVLVEGPTSFIEGGRRKSSRTNFVPLELQPQADKRKTRGTLQSPPIAKSKYGGVSVHKSTPLADSSSKQHSTGSKSTSTQAFRSPATTTNQNGATLKQESNRVAPFKRSHKKKVPPDQSAHPASVASTPLQLKPRRGRPRKVVSPHTTRPAMVIDGWRTSDDEQNDEATIKGEKEYQSSGLCHKPQRLNLRVHPPSVTVQHPGNLPPPRRFPSFDHYISQDKSTATEYVIPLTNRDAQNEADVRRRILEAGQPGGLLSEGHSSQHVPDRQDEPHQQYARQDYMLAAIVNFQKLMGQERVKHKRNARQFAHLALAKWEQRELKLGRGPQKSTEELEKELRDTCEAYYRRTVCGSLRSMWERVTVEIEARRRERWHEEQQRLGREELNKVLARSTRMLHKRTEGAPSQSESGDQESDRSDNESEFMSSTQSDSEDGSVVGAEDDDEGLTVEELRRKYAEAPREFPQQSADEASESDDGDREPMNPDPGGSDSFMGRQDSVVRSQTPDPLSPPSQIAENPANISLEDEIDDALMDDSDASTNMDDDMGDSDDGNDDGGDNDRSEVSGEEEGEEDGALLGFFDKSEYQMNEAIADRSSPTQEVATGDMAWDKDREKLSIPDATQVQTPSASNSEEPFSDARKETSPDRIDPLERVEEVGNAQSFIGLATARSEQQRPLLTDLAKLNTNLDNHQDALPTTPISTAALLTQVPSLLRGTLREYQHIGLDWLARLYADKTNGILADEMGLGKTIQTIALLAHLAVAHEAWGPHLIVVPTSVMLNWEIEFKKFLPGFKVLTYYGTQEERKKKREGWRDDDKWNVWITSYALVVQDNQIFRKRNWHYMVLDEAHNIKNFRSQRWQTLLNFKTRARLLLTGTPLQNNLTELWSLLFFLMPTDSSGSGIGGFADLQQFSEWFRKPVEQILEHGKETMDEEGKAIVKQLHHTLRPYLLRRLKADVEKQMPGKYEHIVYCRLSKRQRELYQGFLNRAETKAIYAAGNHLSMMNCIMQLRKVCCHPDLFETRQIVTSYAMPKSVVADFEIKELLVRRRLIKEDSWKSVDLGFINLIPGANEPLSALETIQTQRVGALGALRQLIDQQWSRVKQDLEFDGSSVKGALVNLENVTKRSRYEALRHAHYLTMLRSQRRPLYSHGLVSRLNLGLETHPLTSQPLRKADLSEHALNKSLALSDMILSLPRRSEAMSSTIQKFTCITPKVVATDLLSVSISPTLSTALRPDPRGSVPDPFHESRVRSAIAFPDKRLLQYDCGKLQSLDALLRKLQAGGHRALVFTQMTKVLDVLEQFLNIHGHRYLRLDGGTKIEQRQILTDRFNDDARIPVFILSTRSGGLGINLTGADTVIFYDSDWNPAMDKQCQDRSHRIGQTRDVHIYRLVSESTVEVNIMRRARQKTRLDEVVIQEGQFTTDHFQATASADGADAVDYGDIETDAALDRVLGGRSMGKAFEQVEDKEDVAAAKVAEKEMQLTDAADFDDKADHSSRVMTPKTPGLQTPGEMLPPLSANPDSVERTTTLDAATSELVKLGADLIVDEEDERLGHIDEYMLQHIEWELEDVPVAATPEKNKKKKKKKGEEHRVRRRL
jgi:helicase SWR1